MGNIFLDGRSVIWKLICRDVHRLFRWYTVGALFHGELDCLNEEGVEAKREWQTAKEEDENEEEEEEEYKEEERKVKLNKDKERKKQKRIKKR